MLGEGENQYLGFVRADGSPVPVDFESPGDFSENNVYNVVLRFTPKAAPGNGDPQGTPIVVVLNISVQDVRKEEGIMMMMLL